MLKVKVIDTWPQCSQSYRSKRKCNPTLTFNVHMSYIYPNLNLDVCIGIKTLTLTYIWCCRVHMRRLLYSRIAIALLQPRHVQLGQYGTVSGLAYVNHSKHWQTHSTHLLDEHCWDVSQQPIVFRISTQQPIAFRFLQCWRYCRLQITYGNDTMYGNSPFGTFTSDPFPDIQPVRSPYINDYVVNVVVQMTMGNVTTTGGTLVICSLTLITNRLDKLGPFGSYPCPYADTLTYSFMLPNGLLYVQSQNNNDSANMITFQQLCSSYYSKFCSVTVLVNL